MKNWIATIFREFTWWLNCRMFFASKLNFNIKSIEMEIEFSIKLIFERNSHKLFDILCRLCWAVLSPNESDDGSGIHNWDAVPHTRRCSNSTTQPSIHVKVINRGSDCTHSPRARNEFSSPRILCTTDSLTDGCVRHALGLGDRDVGVERSGRLRYFLDQQNQCFICFEKTVKLLKNFDLIYKIMNLVHLDIGRKILQFTLFFNIAWYFYNQYISKFSQNFWYLLPNILFWL